MSPKKIAILLATIILAGLFITATVLGAIPFLKGFSLYNQCLLFGVENISPSASSVGVNQPIQFQGTTYCLKSSTMNYWVYSSGTLIFSGYTTVSGSLPYAGSTFSFSYTTSTPGTYQIYAGYSAGMNGCDASADCTAEAQFTVLPGPISLYSATFTFEQNGNGVSGVMASLYFGSTEVGSQTSSSTGVVTFSSLKAETYTMYYNFGGQSGTIQGVTVGSSGNYSQFITLTTTTAPEYQASLTVVSNSGSPIQGLTVELMENGQKVATQTTSSSGQVTFSNLPDGPYTAVIFSTTYSGSTSFTIQDANANIVVYASSITKTSVSTVTSSTTQTNTVSCNNGVCTTVTPSSTNTGSGWPFTTFQTGAIVATIVFLVAAIVVVLRKK